MDANRDLSLIHIYAFQTSITYQYTAPLIPFLMLATVVGLQRIRRRQSREFHWAAIALAATDVYKRQMLTCVRGPSA